MTRNTPLLALPAIAFLLAALALSTGSAAASPGWEIILDRPTPSFGGMDFPSMDEGWLVAGAGLLHSTDGGATWEEQAKLSGIDVDFADTEHGWLVGLSGSIYATADGGERWTPQESGTSVDLLDVAAISATEAWVVGTQTRFGDIAPSFPLRSVLLHTTDGGATWRSVELPPNSWFSELAFVGEQGWALGSRCGEPPRDAPSRCHATVSVLLYTTDSGATWGLLDADLPVAARSLVFVDEEDGWLVGGEEVTAGLVPRVFHTADGGLTWDAQLGGGDWTRIADVVFRDESNGWALLHELLLPSGTLKILTTADGGATWSTYGYTVGTSSGYIHQLNYANGTLYVTSEGPGQALRSTDGGESWRPVDHPALVLTEVDFVDGRTGFGASEGHLLRSDDSGRNWRPVAPLPTGMLRIHFLDTERGLAAGGVCCGDASDFKVYHTEDGGEHWRRVLSTRAFSGGTYVHDIEFVDSQNGWIALEGGFGFTDDGGASWRVVPIVDAGPYAQVYDADLADVGDAWAIVATNDPTQSTGGLIHTSDGGEHWQEVPIVPDSNPQQVEFVDATHGWYVSQDGPDGACQTTLFATNDGGATWTAASTQVQLAYPWDFIFVDRVNGWAKTSRCDEGGCGSEVLHTADSGRTWSPQLSGDLITGSFDFLDARTGWFLLDPTVAIGCCTGPPGRTVLYHTADGGGGPIGVEPTPAFPDVGDGGGGANGDSHEWMLAAAIGVAALAASALVARRARR